MATGDFIGDRTPITQYDKSEVGGTKTEEFKERIAQRLFELDGGYSEDWLTLCGSDAFYTKEEYYFRATQILKACKEFGLVFYDKWQDNNLLGLQKKIKEIEL